MDGCGGRLGVWNEKIHNHYFFFSCFGWLAAVLDKIHTNFVGHDVENGSSNNIHRQYSGGMNGDVIRAEVLSVVFTQQGHATTHHASV